MRTTVDLPDDIHKYARDLAHDRNSSFSAALVEIIERGMYRLPEVQIRTSPITGLPTMHFGGRLITTEDVRALEDDE